MRRVSLTAPVVLASSLNPLVEARRFNLGPFSQIYGDMMGNSGERFGTGAVNQKLSKETVDAMAAKVKELSGADHGSLYKFDKGAGLTDKHKVASPVKIRMQPAVQSVAEGLGIDVNNDQSILQADTGDSGSSGSGATSGQKGPKAAPMICQVPMVCERVVGRSSVLFGMWQELLGGKRLHLIQGYQGLGTSSLAMEFASVAQRARRFSCIKWFDAQDGLVPRLKEFYREVRHRSEIEVMLIFDNVTDLKGVQRLLPKHPGFHVVITTPVVDVAEIPSSLLELSKATLSLIECPPLGPTDSMEMLQAPVGAQEMAAKLCLMLGHVPLLLRLAASLMQPKAASVTPVISFEDLCALLEADYTAQGEVVSISRVLGILTTLAVKHLSNEFGASLSCNLFTAMAYYDGRSISGGVVRQLLLQSEVPPPERDIDIVETALAIGLIQPQWDGAEDCFMVHPLVAKTVGPIFETSHQGKSLSANMAAGALMKLWPRRMRGDGRNLALVLAKHVVAILAAQDAASQESALLCRAAMKSGYFLAHTEGKLLDIAITLWRGAYALSTTANTDLSLEEKAALCKDFGSLLQQQGGAGSASTEISEVLQRALSLSKKAYGEASKETALVVASMATTLPSTIPTKNLLQVAADSLQQQLDSASMSAEETLQLKKCLFGLMVRSAQLAEEMGGEAPPSLWAQMEKLHAEVNPESRRRL